MISNTVKSSFRSLRKNGGHAIINLVGLSLGITSAIILFLVVRFELSFDNYHPDKERIYRIITDRVRAGEQNFTAGVTYPLPAAVRSDFPDFEFVSIVDSNNGDPVFGVTRVDGNIDRFKETLVTFADPDYFRLFDYEWIEGDANALEVEKTVVINESIAKKYFGEARALGKVISYNDKYDLTVSGVIKDAPLNTDLPFRAVISDRLGADAHAWDNWESTSSSVNCFVKLKPGIEAGDVEKKMKGWHMKYFTGEAQEEGERQTFLLQPLSEMHFDERSELSTFSGRIISKTTIWSLALIGILLLATACINFVNLNTVLIFNRAKEVGIRKTLGGTKLSLLNQFLGETLTITAISLVISAGLVELSLMFLSPTLGYQLQFDPLTNLNTMMMMMGVLFFVTAFAGIYPALSLANFHPIRALKNKIDDRHSGGFTMRRSLIVIQLCISQALIICTLVVMQQMDYFMDRPMGLDSSAIVEFELPENRTVDLPALKERIARVSGVQSVSMSNTGSTGETTWGGDYEASIGGEVVSKDAKLKFADEDYVETYKLELLVGEDFVRSDSADRFLVNEAFVRSHGLNTNEEAIGIQLKTWGRTALIKGVVKDFHATSLRDEILPIIIIPDKKGFYHCAVKLSTTEIGETMEQVGKAWNQFFPAYIFEYTFLDDTIKKFYEEERRTSNLLMLFSSIAILIGCIGLFGLISFLVAKRTKEVGIRKTLGASVTQIVSLFTKEFFILTLVSFVIAAPVSRYFMNNWLNNFAYRINIGIATFLISVGLLFLIVLLTVGFKSIAAASSNPVNALKDE